MIHNTPEVNWKFEYVGDIIFRNGYPNRILTDTGHIDMTGPSPAYQWNETFSDYDFSARYFSTSSSRFTTQAPLAEKTPHLSPLRILRRGSDEICRPTVARRY